MQEFMARRVQYPSSVKVYQLNKANLFSLGVGQNGKEALRSMLGHTENIKNKSTCSFHRPTSSQRLFSTTPAHTLSKQSALSLWCLWDTQESCWLLQRGQANLCGLYRKPSHWICTRKKRRHGFIDPHPSLVNRNNWGFILICVGCSDVIKSSSRCVQSFVNKEIIGP